MSHVYDIAIDYQTPEQQKEVAWLLKYGLWVEAEVERKQPHAIHEMEHTVDEPLSKEDVAKLRESLRSSFEDNGGYRILGIAVKEEL